MWCTHVPESFLPLKFGGNSLWEKLFLFPFFENKEYIRCSMYQILCSGGWMRIGNFNPDLPLDVLGALQLSQLPDQSVGVDHGARSHSDSTGICKT